MTHRYNAPPNTACLPVLQGLLAPVLEGLLAHPAAFKVNIASAADVHYIEKNWGTPLMGLAWVIKEPRYYLPVVASVKATGRLAHASVLAAVTAMRKTFDCAGLNEHWRSGLSTNHAALNHGLCGTALECILEAPASFDLFTSAMHALGGFVRSSSHSSFDEQKNKAAFGVFWRAVCASRRHGCKFVRCPNFDMSLPENKDRDAGENYGFLHLARTVHVASGTKIPDWVLNALECMSPGVAAGFAEVRGLSSRQLQQLPRLKAMLASPGSSSALAMCQAQSLVKCDGLQQLIRQGSSAGDVLRAAAADRGDVVRRWYAEKFSGDSSGQRWYMDNHKGGEVVWLDADRYIACWLRVLALQRGKELFASCSHYLKVTKCGEGGAAYADMFFKPSGAKTIEAKSRRCRCQDGTRVAILGQRCRFAGVVLFKGNVAGPLCPRATCVQPGASEVNYAVGWRFEGAVAAPHGLRIRGAAQQAVMATAITGAQEVYN